MHDSPALLLAVVVAAYRGRVGVLAGRIRRRTRAPSAGGAEEGVLGLPWPFVVSLVAALLTASAAASPRTAVEVAARLATLDCRQVSAAEVDAVLAAAPAPRIIALEGSVPIVTMEPFAAFLESMGYPAERLANPADGKRSYGSFVASRRVAGELAWHYEREGLMPMLIGHSRGGMVVIRTLNDLAGVGGEPIPVWDPARDEPEARTTIVDPFTGQSRPVVGLRVDYAVAMATGSPARRLLGQWGVVPLLREVPDSVVEFTGFAIPWDPIAGTGPDPAPFRATGLARVRNIVLPASYSHIGLPRTDHLAREPATRAWINAFFPGTTAPPPADVDTANLFHAADIWYSIKQHWCGGAQRLLARPASAGLP